ncbi:UPF0496 protein At3g19330-like isoform X1 [Ipomoea triloba]|uniref:UPF0496 protein At3g19330-like isoform X1 n=1 Tax=Ipomoea triloba TaxID=35885 RepID=UPI00125D22DC|nr:UPF0496 protein At3g19330-like isoform X1 [Ipomoea triloba]
MLPCLRPSSSTTTTNTQFSQSTVDGISVANTPRSSDQTTPSVDLTREYNLAIQTSSCCEIWSKIHYEVPSDQDEVVNFHDEPLQVEEVLKPSRECVEEAFSRVRPDNLSQLVINYFNHSEHTTQSCLSLIQCIHRARQIYSPLHKLIDIFPIDFETATNSLSQAQCDWAFDAFVQFDKLDNPFPGPDSYSFVDMHGCFSQLKQQLDIRLQKSRSKVQLLRRGTKGAAICLTITTFGVVVSAIVIATHALVALVAAPLCPLLFTSKMTKEERVHLVQLDDATRGIFVLHSHLETIDCLVARLHNSVEDYKRLIRFGLERVQDNYPIQEVILQLQKKHNNFLDQLTGLEEHLCLCFAAINRARSLLLSYFHLHI